MELDEAYRILEVEPGSNEEAVREARKLLAKVWHPDRHANDPTLQARAQGKLADINAAFEVVNTAGFPAKPAAKPRPPTAPPQAESATEPRDKYDPRAAPASRAKYDPRVDPQATSASRSREPAIEFVPRRRVRWSVILVLAAALGVGAYLAITKLGSSSAPAPREPVVVAADAALLPVDATIVVADVAEPLLDATPAVVRREKTFTLGSSRADVIAAQGQPNGTKSSTSIVNGVRTSSAQLRWGDSSTVDFDGDDKVIGWAEGDSPLHVRLEIRDPAVAAAAKARGTFTAGATADEVLGILGPPHTLAGTTWSYGTSTIELANGKVTKVSQGEPKLPVR